MSKINKKIVVLILVICMTMLFTACNSKDDAWLKSADSQVGSNLSLNEKLNWGMSVDDVKALEKGPYDSNYETYIAVWKDMSFPADGKWKKDSESINKKAFKKTDITSYYVFNENKALFEYGSQFFDVNLYQYDFLKEYYTKKFGKPKKEEYIWNDKKYKPTGKENLHDEFKKGMVKVLTAWDIDENDTVLVIDWLNDPQKTENNYGQISFMEKTQELNTETQSENE